MIGAAAPGPASSTRLVDLLRERGALGVKEGCGVGDCGACVVLVAGEARLSCVTLAGQVEVDNVMSVAEVLSTPFGTYIAAALLSDEPFQCGFCAPGMICAAYAAMASGPTPRVDERPRHLTEAISGHVCRCTGYLPVLDAFLSAWAAWDAAHGQTLETEDHHAALG